MLILLIQNIIQTSTDALRVLITSKIQHAQIETIYNEELVSHDLTRYALVITQDKSMDASLYDCDVIVWEEFSELSAKLDMFSQLKRYLSQYPLTLKKWTLKEVLYNGNDAIIYRAKNRRGDEVAIKHFKYLPSLLSSHQLEDFIAKVKRNVCIKHKGVVRYIEGGIYKSSFYLVMEYLPYGTLRQTLNGCGNQLPIHHALEWFQEIVIALDAVHKAGLIYRDLKIDNILMRGDGSLALLDYGVSKQLLLDAGFIHEQELYCSPHYVSPEQIRGDACTKFSDIYSLGVIFYELLTGRKPYSANKTYELMMHHVMAPVPILPEELRDFQFMIDKMMAKEPKDRYSSAIDALNNMPIAA